MVFHQFESSSQHSATVVIIIDFEEAFNLLKYPPGIANQYFKLITRTCLVTKNVYNVQVYPDISKTDDMIMDL